MDDHYNQECMECPLRFGCLAICATKPEDVIRPICGKYAIGITGDRNDVFWTRPVDAWRADPLNTHPKDLRFVVVPEVA